jgi:DNA-binding NtrC family response regulator
MSETTSNEVETTKSAAGVFEAPAAGPRAREGQVLLVCQSPELRLYIQKGLSQAELEFYSIETLAQARELLGAGSPAAAFEVVLAEIPEPLPDGQARALGELCRDFPQVWVLAIAPKPSAELVRQAMVLGVRDFLTNPFQRAEIGAAAKDAVARCRAARPSAPPCAVVQGGRDAAAPEREAAPDAAEAGDAGSPTRRRSGGGAEAPAALDDFITCNDRMRRVLEIIDRVAPTNSTVLIEGESGTGKELIARRIHHLSNRAGGPFIEVNCGAIPPNLLESQLFGHEKGSFTGAFARQMGLFEIADSGTIFLDEIAEMNLEMQVKLLRVLQERSFRRIGGKQSIQVDVRVVAATNRELKSEVEASRFRADLFYRLNVISLSIPPLRDRLEDIPRLVEFFAERFHRDKGLARKRFHPEAYLRLQKKRWVGNVRELENTVERLVLLSSGEEVCPEDLEDQAEPADLPAQSAFAPTLTLDEVKKLHIASVLQANGGNKMKTARILGINVKTLYNLIQRLGIQV